MTCKILDEPTLAESLVENKLPTIKIGDRGESDLSQAEKFERLCNFLDKGEDVVVMLFGDTWYRGVVEQAALARGYDVLHARSATELVAA